MLTQQKIWFLCSLVLFFALLAVLYVGLTNPLSPSISDGAPAARPGAAIAQSSDIPASIAPKDTTSEDVAHPSDWRSLVNQTDLRDLPEITNSLMKISDPEERARALGALISRSVLENARPLYEYLDRLAMDAEFGDAAWSKLVTELGDAFSYVSESAATSSELAAVVRRVVAGMAGVQPDKALEWADTWLLGDALDSARAIVAGQLAQSNPTRAVNLIEIIDSDVRRHEAINQASPWVGETDLDSALAWASSLRNETETALAVNGILLNLSESNTPRAVEVFQTFCRKLEDSHRLKMENEKAALLAEGYTRTIDEAGYEVLRKDDADVHFSPIHPETELLREAIGQIANSLGRSNPDQAVAWAKTLPEGVLRTRGLEAAMLGSAENDPATAFRQLREVFPRESEPAETLFHVWALDDPASALQAVQQLQGIQREAAMAGLTAGWLDHGGEYRAIRQWAVTLPSTRERDRVLVELIHSGSMTHPKFAWEDAMKISDSRLRIEAIRVAFPALIREDPALARASAQTSMLTDQERSVMDRMLLSTN